MIQKLEAIRRVMEATGLGEWTVSKRFDLLEVQGIITIISSPSDKRVKLVSEQDVEKVIKSLSLPQS